MRGRGRGAGAWPALLVVGVLLGAGAVTGVRAEAPASRIVVRVTGLRSDSGSVRCSLYDGPEGFPEGQKHVVARARALPSGKAATCTFDAPARGKRYAVVIHHDENDDGKFQRGALGIPLEGYGFSNNVRPVVAAPSFEACAFTFNGGEHALGVTARY